MFTINPEGIITASRGDTFEAPLFINAGSKLEPKKYFITTNDEIYIGVMEANQLFENAIIRKKYTYEDINKDGVIIVKFNPEDTIYLQPGKYYYQIKLKSNTTVNTITPKQLFYIIE